MIRLGDLAMGRDNNFNLIRFAAATAVLVSHAWPLALGPGAAEPLKALTGHSLGTLSVFVFFAVSGFFIAASFDRAPSRRSFLAARALRLFPCLAVSLLLVALVLGPLVSTLAPGAYLAHPETAAFLWRNLTLLWPQFRLPGVFETNPYPDVEGSIWTLIHEVLCYGLVLLAGLAGLLRRPGWMLAALFGYALFWGLTETGQLRLGPRPMATRTLSLPFVIGMAFYVWRHRLRLSFPVLAAILGAAWLAAGTILYDPLLMLAIAYGVFWLAYAPRGRIRGFNRLGDYSYGIYVYAFPLQGLAVWLFGPMGPGLNILLSLPLTLGCAVLSWHLVEKPALGLRRHVDPPRPPRVPSAAE